MSEQQFTEKLRRYFHSQFRDTDYDEKIALRYARNATEIYFDYQKSGYTHKEAMDYAQRSIQRKLDTPSSLSPPTNSIKPSVYPGGSLYEEEVAKQRKTQEALVDVRSPTRGTSSHPSAFHYAAATADEDIQDHVRCSASSNAAPTSTSKHRSNDRTNQERSSKKSSQVRQKVIYHGGESLHADARQNVGARTPIHDRLTHQVHDPPLAHPLHTGELSRHTQSRKSHGKDVSGRGRSPVRGAAKYQSSALHDTSKEQDAYYVSKDIRIDYKKPSFVGSSHRPRKPSQTEGTHQANSPFASAGDHKPRDRSHTPTKFTKDSGGPKVSETVSEQSSDEEFDRAPSPGPQQSRPPSISSESPDEGMAPGQKPPVDLYKFLDIARSDDTATVKDAYFKMIKKCHPDKWNSLPDGDEVKEENKRKAAYLNATKDVLLDADKRAFYDETGLMS